MQNFQDTFKTRKQSNISAFSFCMTVPVTQKQTKTFSARTKLFQTS